MKISYNNMYEKEFNLTKKKNTRNFTKETTREKQDWDHERIKKKKITRKVDESKCRDKTNDR